MILFFIDLFFIFSFFLRHWHCVWVRSARSSGSRGIFFVRPFPRAGTALISSRLSPHRQHIIRRGPDETMHFNSPFTSTAAVGTYIVMVVAGLSSDATAHTRPPPPLHLSFFAQGFASSTFFHGGFYHQDCKVRILFP